MWWSTAKKVTKTNLDSKASSSIDTATATAAVEPKIPEKSVEEDIKATEVKF